MTFSVADVLEQQMRDEWRRAQEVLNRAMFLDGKDHRTPDEEQELTVLKLRILQCETPDGL